MGASARVDIWWRAAVSKDKPDAWMRLFPADWDADTAHLDCEQDGAYGRIVRNYWRSGPPADDDVQLARIVRMPLARWRKVRPVIAAFFTIVDGKWRHKRVDHEWEISGAKRAKAIERAAKGAAGRWKKDASSMPQAMLEQCPSASASATEVDGPTGQSTLCGQKGGNSRGKGAKWPGPADFREAVVAAKGESWAQSWLDPTHWQDVPAPAIVCKVSFTAERLRRDLRVLLRERQITVTTQQEAAA